MLYGGCAADFVITPPAVSKPSDLSAPGSSSSSSSSSSNKSSNT